MKQNQYKGTHLGRSFLAQAAALSPQLGLSGLATLIPIINASLLADANIPVNVEEMVNSMPSDKALLSMVTKQAAESLLLAKRSIMKNPFVYLACDKGNKKGNKMLAKFVCWYCIDEKKVKTYMIDCDCVDEDTQEIVDGIKHSLLRFFQDDLTKLIGQCTDSGGGGTKKALKRALEEANLLSGDGYLLATCCLHNLQTALRVAVENVLGEGGMDSTCIKMNLMQMIHGAYNIQNYHESEELSDLWTFLDANATKLKLLEEPVLSRWWTVSACAVQFRESK